MRILAVLMCALAALAAPSSAHALDVFATSFFAPENGDPDPGLNGVLRINTQTGAVSTFIPETPGGFSQPTDLVVDETTQTLYVATQGGRIWHYNAFTGAPRPSLVAGEPAGVFALLPTAGFSDGVNSLLLRSNTLLAATAFGSITPFNLFSGLQGDDVVQGLSFPSGMTATPGGEILVATGSPFGLAGELLLIGDDEPVVLADSTSTPTFNSLANPTVVRPRGDFTLDGSVDVADRSFFLDTYGSINPFSDPNGDGVIDAADYTLYRDNLGEEARVYVADLNGNQLVSYALDGSDGQTVATIGPAIPDPLPPSANPLAPSNSPSEILVTDEGTLLVSTLGLTRRPDNRGALIEFDRNGTFIRTIADGLPPLSGMAFAPVPLASGSTVPEPTAMLIAVLGLTPGLVGRRG